MLELVCEIIRTAGKRSVTHRVSSCPQALEMEVSDHLRARSGMSDALKSKQKEVQRTLKTLDKEVKLR